MRVLGALANREGMIAWLPFGSGWTRDWPGAKNPGRFMPAPQGRTFRELYAEKR